MLFSGHFQARRLGYVLGSGKVLTLTLEKPHLKLFSNFGKKIYKTKPALPSSFALGPKGVWEVFEDFVFLQFS